MSNTTNRPAFEAVIREEAPEGETAVWRKIGAAWWNGSRQGLNLVLEEALPGRTTVYLRAPKAERPKAAG